MRRRKHLSIFSATISVVAIGCGTPRGKCRTAAACLLLLLVGCRNPNPWESQTWKLSQSTSPSESSEDEINLRRLAPFPTPSPAQTGARDAASDAVRLVSFAADEAPLPSDWEGLPPADAGAPTLPPPSDPTVPMPSEAAGDGSAEFRPDRSGLASPATRPGPSPEATSGEEVLVPAAGLSAAGELTLEEAIWQTMQGNPDLVSASAQLAMADAALSRARAEFYPKLGVSENYGVTNNPVYAFMYQLNQGNLSLAQDFNRPPTIDNFQTQVRLEHRVYAGEQRLHEEHAAEAGVSVAAHRWQAVRNQLVYRVAEAYYRLLQARDLVDVREEAVSQVEQHLEIVQSRFRNGTAVKSDVLTVQVRLAEVREAMITARNQQQLAWAVLANVTGCPLETRPLPSTIPPAPWNDSIEQIQIAVAQAIADRPEIGVAESQQLAAAEGIEVARAGKRLGVDVVADYDLYTGDFLRGNDSFFVGVMFHLNLYDGGRTQADVCKALAKVRQVQAEQRRTLLDIELDVRRAHLQLEDAQARQKVANQTVRQAKESLREIEVRYQGQTATITELVDAQVALSNARVRHTNAQADVEIARAALQRAMGRLTDML